MWPGLWKQGISALKLWLIFWTLTFSLNTAMPLKLFWYIDNLFRIHMKFTELIYRNYWTRKVPDCILCRYARLSQAQPDTRGWTAFWGEFFVKMVFTPGKTLTSTSRPYTSCVHFRTVNWILFYYMLICHII